MKQLFLFALGFVLAPLVLQWLIVATREPVRVRCDGGMEDLMSDREIDA